MIRNIENEKDISKFYGDVKICSDNMRLGFAATSSEEACLKLKKAIDKLQKYDSVEWDFDGIYFRSQGLSKKDKTAIVVMKPLESSEYMQNGTTINYPEMKEAFRKADNVQLSEGKTPISKLLYPLENESIKNSGLLNEIQERVLSNAAITVGIIKILKHRGLKPNYYTVWDVFSKVAECEGGNIKEKQAFKKVCKASRKLEDKVNYDNLFGRGCENTNAVVYKNKVGFVYPQLLKNKDYSDGYYKSSANITECLKYIDNEGTKAVILINCLDGELRQIKNNIHLNDSAFVNIDINTTDNSQIVLEEAIAKLRVLGLEIKPDIYLGDLSQEEDEEKKHLMRINPRIYRSKEKEKIVKAAVSDMFVPSELNIDRKGSLGEKTIEVSKDVTEIGYNQENHSSEKVSDSESFVYEEKGDGTRQKNKHTTTRAKYCLKNGLDYNYEFEKAKY